MPAVSFSNQSIYLLLHGLLIGFGVWHGLHLVRKEGRNRQMPVSQLMDLCFVVLITAAVGSRLPYLVLNRQLLVDDPMEVFRIWHGGVEFYGGFLTAFVCGVIFISKRKMPLWQTADLFAPAVAMGTFWGKLGYIGLGVARGQELYRLYLLSPGKFDWMNAYAVQVFLAILNLFMYFILIAVGRKRRYVGQLFWLYVLMNSASMTIVYALWKIDDLNWFDIMTLPKSIIGCTLILMAAGMLMVLKHRNRKAKAVNLDSVAP